MIEIEVEIQGLSAYIADRTFCELFKTVKTEYGYIPYGPNKGTMGYHSKTVNLFNLKRNGGFYVGFGAITWLISKGIPFKIKSINPKRGNLLPFSVPEKMSSSSKFKVDGKDRFYFFEALEACRIKPYGLVKLPTGCHSKDTGILMYNGEIKLVQDIIVGDKLMGPDSKPREVLSLIRGFSDKMFKVIPQGGVEPFICNEDHILSLRSKSSLKDLKHPYGSLINISIKEYREKYKAYKYISKLWATGLDFPETEIKYDPYVIGCYICKDTNEKIIPPVYILNSRRVRLELLAGLLDYNKNLSKNSCSFPENEYSFAKQVQFLLRSLGFSCSFKEKIIKTSKKRGPKKVFVLEILGDLSVIPFRYRDRRGSPKNKFTNEYNFSIERLPGDNFYGFELDKDGLYLLDNFIVTHNSGKGELLLTLADNQFKQLGMGLILVPTISIKEQLLERSVRYNIPSIEYNNYEGEDKILIATAKGVYDKIKANDSKTLKILSKVKFLTLDESHHISSDSWKLISLNLINCQRCHGFSALPLCDESIKSKTSFRDISEDDARTINMMGGVIYEKNSSELRDFLNLPVMINYEYDWTFDDLSNKNSIDWHTVNKNVTNNINRTKVIANMLDYLVHLGYKVITFTKEKDHAEQILKFCRNKKTSCWFGGGKVFNKEGKSDSSTLRKEFGTEVMAIICTSHAIEGLDLGDAINALLLHDGKSARQIIQKVGRIVRPDDRQSLIINVMDEGCKILKKQSISRSEGICKEFDIKAVTVTTMSSLNQEILNKNTGEVK